VGIIQVNAVEKGLNFETARIVIKDANTLLATAKNSEDGGGHGH
jgi:cobalt-zinc-cadmium efflux system membrane fusion protein